MAHPRTAILETFCAALSGLSSVQTVYTHAALPIPEDKLPALAIVPGEESLEGAEHEAMGTVRRLRVRVVCTADTRERADEIAAEVEQEAPYTTAGLGAFYAGSDFGEDGRGDSVFYSVLVKFDVLYEVTVA